VRLTSFKGDVKPEIGIYSFGENCDKKPQAQFEFDVSKFRDPVGQKQFNKAVGTQADVRDWVGQDKRVPALVQQCRILAEDLIRPHKKDGKDEQISAWLSLSFKDHHGKWISPAIAELVANQLDLDGFKVVVCHHNLDPTLE
jgi:RNase adaptor protein for sRNA GlmZ degradation